MKMKNEKIINKIRSLTLQNKEKVKHRLLFEAVVRDERHYIDEVVDWLERTSFVNDKDNGVSNLPAITALAKVSVTLLNELMAKQARQEMQAMSEHSVFGMKLADQMNDLSADARDAVNNLSALSAHYQVVLAGRRAGVHYLDSEGTSKPYSEEQSKSSQLMKGFIPELLKGEVTEK